jgi:hypothetical protein
MNLLHSIAAIVERLPRTAATGALACAAGSPKSDLLGAYRPSPRDTLIA